MPIDTSFSGLEQLLNFPQRLEQRRQFNEQLELQKRELTARQRQNMQQGLQEAVQQQRLQDEANARAQATARRFQGMKAMQKDIAESKMKPSDALLKHAPDIFFDNPQALGSFVGGEENRDLRLKQAEDLSGHRAEQIRLREENLDLMREKIKTMSEEKEADRALKAGLQKREQAMRKELEQLRQSGAKALEAQRETGRKERLQTSIEAALKRSDQIPGHKERDMYKAEIRQLENSFPSDAEFEKGSREIMRKYNVKPAGEMKQEPVQPAASTPAPARQRLRFNPATGTFQPVQ